MINRLAHHSPNSCRWLLTWVFVASGYAAADDEPDGRIPLDSRLFHGLPSQLSLSVSGGLRYEDSLMVEETDSISRQSDVAVQSSLDVGYKNDITGSDRIKVGYHFEQRQFQNQTNFDLLTHYGFVDYSHNFGDIRVGATIDTTIAELGGANLLDSQQAGLYGSGMATKKLYLRVGTIYKQTEFSKAPDRSSETGKIEANVYYFLQEANEYLGVGYLFETEKTQLDSFDHDANNLTLKYNKKLLFERGSVNLKADLRFQHREYVVPTPSISAPRKDYRYRWRVRLEAPVTKSIDIELKYEHREYFSNLELLDFVGDSVVVRLILKL